MPGTLHIVQSMMFGGKTSFGLRILGTTGFVEKSLYINTSIDVRSTKGYSTHNSMFDDDLSDKLNAEMMKIDKLSSIPEEKIKSYRVIVIDEAQFFDDIMIASEWVDKYDVDVWVLSLSGDYMRGLFGKVHLLFPHADEIIMLRDTYCRNCASQKVKSKALFTHRKEDNSKTQIEIGAANYMPVCRKCYLELKK